MGRKKRGRLASRARNFQLLCRQIVSQYLDNWIIADMKICSLFTYPLQEMDVNLLTFLTTIEPSLNIGLHVQGISLRPFPGCENAAGKLRQKW